MSSAFSLDVAADTINGWYYRPDLMVEDLFGVVPDAWQRDVLQAFPHHPRIAMTACKGPGKTATLAWLGWNFLLTRPYPKAVATSITADNLRDGLWTEMARWQRESPLLLEQFRWTAERITRKRSPETWWMAARAWAKGADPSQQADTLAGLHDDHMLFLCDEAGGYPDAVIAAAEAGLANAGLDGREAHLVIAGNPTQLSGPLYRANTTERALWWMIHISSAPDDPRRTPRVSVDWAQAQIEKYGADNPWVLVNVYGRFPPAALNALLGPDEVRAAMERHLPITAYERAARVLGVDVARQGDDRSVIWYRQGLAHFPPIVLRNVDSLQGAARVSRAWAEREADACYVDATGGWGWGWIDQLRVLNRSPIPVPFSGKPMDAQFLNLRAEMYWRLAQDIRQGAALPNEPDLLAELTSTEYYFRGDKIALIEKDQVKERIGRSPDMADAAALTYAMPTIRRDSLVAETLIATQQNRAVSDYDPHERA